MADGTPLNFLLTSVPVQGAVVKISREESERINHLLRLDNARALIRELHHYEHHHDLSSTGTQAFIPLVRGEHAYTALALCQGIQGTELEGISAETGKLTLSPSVNDYLQPLAVQSRIDFRDSLIRLEDHGVLSMRDITHDHLPRGLMFSIGMGIAMTLYAEGHHQLEIDQSKLSSVLGVLALLGSATNPNRQDQHQLLSALLPLFRHILAHEHDPELERLCTVRNLHAAHYDPTLYTEHGGNMMETAQRQLTAILNTPVGKHVGLEETSWRSDNLIIETRHESPTIGIVHWIPDIEMTLEISEARQQGNISVQQLIRQYEGTQHPVTRWPDPSELGATPVTT